MEVSFHLHCAPETLSPAAVDTFIPLTCYVGLISVISDLEETRNVCVCVRVVQLQLTIIAEVIHQNNLTDQMNWSSVQNAGETKENISLRHAQTRVYSKQKCEMWNMQEADK